MQDQVEEEEEVVVVLAWVLVLLAGCLQVRDRCLGVNQEAGSAEEVVVVDLVEVVVVWVDLVVVVALVVVLLAVEEEEEEEEFDPVLHRPTCARLCVSSRRPRIRWMRRRTTLPQCWRRDRVRSCRRQREVSVDRSR